MTVKFGLCNSCNGYREAIKALNYQIGHLAELIFDKIGVSQTEKELHIVLISGSALGFKKGAELRTIYARIVELGGQLAPAETGPALCLNPKNLDSRIRIAMEPIRHNNGTGYVFSLYKTVSGSVWLNADWAFRVYDPNDIWVYVSSSIMS